MPRKGCLRSLKVTNEGPLLELQRSRKQNQGRSYVRSNLTSLHLPDIFLIQETKMEEAAFLHVSQKIWKNKGKAAISSRGVYGSIGTLWNDKEFDAVTIKYSTH